MWRQMPNLFKMLLHLFLSFSGKLQEEGLLGGDVQILGKVLVLPFRGSKNYFSCLSFHLSPWGEWEVQEQGADCRHSSFLGETPSDDRKVRMCWIFEAISLALTTEMESFQKQSQGGSSAPLPTQVIYSGQCISSLTNVYVLGAVPGTGAIWRLAGQTQSPPFGTCIPLGQ